MGDTIQSAPSGMVPKATELKQDEFPFPTKGPPEQPVAQDARSNSNPIITTHPEPEKPMARDHVQPPNQVRVPQLARIGTDILAPSRPPRLQKAYTASPAAPRTRMSIPGRRHGATTTKQEQQTRNQVTYEHSESDSSSSSSSESDSETEETHTASRTRALHEHRRPRMGQGKFSTFRIANENFRTKGHVSSKDGRLKISIHEAVNSGYFAKTLGVGLKSFFKGDDEEETAEDEVPGVTQRNEPASQQIAPERDAMEQPSRRVRLNICIIVIGSRGDIQPFIKIGRILRDDYGHRVRIATHPAFKKFVEEECGLEFFSVGGNPAELMSFMVKNPGLLPSVETIKEGEVGKRRAAMYDMFQGMWRACVNSTDDETDKANMKMMGDKSPFVADAIIANPPSFAPPHIAERLGIPLHMMFTFPYTPTSQFPHPLANIQSSNVDANYTNFMSYPLVEMMTWQGLGDLINRFRVQTLFLEEVSTLWAPGQLYRLKVPYTYLWSPGLVPKPKDWGPEIDIAGFVFLELGSSFKPPESLVKFLEAGPPPVYIGFGSIVVDDPVRFTKLIFKAVELAGVRALVSEGWGGIGDRNNTPDNIYILDNTPHDWLFPKVSAVVHHGGAGTTAIGLKCGKPTVIVPFFGDQPFWGAMTSKARAGASQAIPYKNLTAEQLAESIKECLTDEAQTNAKKIAEKIASEGDGAQNAARSFHRMLKLDGEKNMRCNILENRVAAWRVKNTTVNLSPLAAELLVEWKKIKWNELRLVRHEEWSDFGGPGEPLTGGWGAIISTFTGVASGVGSIPVHMAKSIKKRKEHEEKKKRVKKRQHHVKKTLENVNQGPDGNSNDTGATLTTLPSTGRPALPQRQETTLSKLSEPEETLAEELALEAGHGFKKTFTSLLNAPMDFMLAITLGFHNAPRLYGDPTVRPPTRITGFHSGCRAARDEFLHGIHDGVTGIWRQPIRELQAHEHSVPVSLIRGVGMGFGGLILKDIAAGMGPVAFPLKGIYEEARKSKTPEHYLRRARIIQGRKELAAMGRGTMGKQELLLAASDDDDRGQAKKEVELRVARRWEELQKRMQEERNAHKSVRLRNRLLHLKLKHKSHSGGTNGANRTPKSGPRKANSQPLSRIEGTKAKDDLEPMEAKRAETAPGKSLEWKRKVRRKGRVEQLPTALKEEAKREGLGEPTAINGNSN